MDEGSVSIAMDVRKEWRKAKFYTKPNLHIANPLQLHSITRKWVDTFIAGEEKVGWELIAKPIVQRIRVVEEKDIGPSRISDIGGLWHPYMLAEHFLISSDHPFAREDQDLYMIWAPMRIEWKPITIEVPDEVIEEGRLPKGWEVV